MDSSLAYWKTSRFPMKGNRGANHGLCMLPHHNETE